MNRMQLLAILNCLLHSARSLTTCANIAPSDPAAQWDIYMPDVVFNGTANFRPGSTSFVLDLNLSFVFLNSSLVKDSPVSHPLVKLQSTLFQVELLLMAHR
ncbi:hypothetical protein F5884DRAFT_808858 [Xylogone sp. PMI_703]|nr:hypothetical protein F5884DRAFT_808858 [Xylogone sp. PMI_703]